MPPVRRFVALALACLAAAAVPARAQTPDVPLILTQAYQYVPGDVEDPELALKINQGETLKFLNLDWVGGFHTITAEDVDRQGTPVFDTGVQAPGALADVAGTGALKPGTYRFYCAVHGALVMEGALTVV
jgi:plastocyanin